MEYDVLVYRGDRAGMVKKFGGQTRMSVANQVTNELNRCDGLWDDKWEMYFPKRTIKSITIQKGE